MSNRIMKNLVDLVTGTFISRVLGFVRELITAAYYGTHRAMDLFVIAFTIPTFFRHFLGEDVVERAFMPPFKKLLSQGKHAAGWRLLSSCLNGMIIVLLVLLALLYLFAPLIVKAIAPGLEDDFFPKAIAMTYWILPFMFIIGLAAFVGSVLNFFEMNKIYSLAPAMMSVGVMLGIILFKSSLGIYALPAGFLLGGLLELIIQIPYLWHPSIRKETQARFFPGIDLKQSEFRVVGRESGFIFLKSFLDKSIEIVDRILASYLIAGSIASLWFAQRLIQLPVAIIGLAISRSLIPYLTEKKAQVRDEEFIQGIHLGIQLNFAMILPTITYMVVMAQPIIAIVYQRGSFDAASTNLTAIAFWCYSIGLLGLSVNTFFSRLFSIYQKNKIPLYIAIFSVSINILLDFLLVRTALKHGGIALASSITFSFSCLLLYHFLKKEVGPQLNTREILFDLLKLGVNSLIVGVVIYLLFHRLIQPYLEPKFHSAFMQHTVSLSIVGAATLLLYVAFIFVWGPRNLKQRLVRLIPSAVR
ncbi:MAG: murein biosynthesis integral membrane protein MurJ [Candidatus Zhuqueibacterota bacterium]